MKLNILEPGGLLMCKLVMNEKMDGIKKGSKTPPAITKTIQ